MIKLNNYELRLKIVKLALLQLEKEYVHGCHGPNKFDCAGLVWYIYNEILGIDLYKYGYGISTTTKMMTSKIGTLTTIKEDILEKDKSLLNIGDILFFHRQSLKEYEPTLYNKYPGHCGIYLGNNEFIHCSRTKGKVVKTKFNNYWNKKYVGYKKLLK